MIHAKNSETVVIAVDQDLGTYRYAIWDGQGKAAGSGQVRLDHGTREFKLPVSGLLTLEPVTRAPGSPYENSGRR